MSDYDYDDGSYNEVRNFSGQYLQRKIDKINQIFEQSSSSGTNFMDKIETFQDLILWKLENGYDSNWEQLKNQSQISEESESENSMTFYYTYEIEEHEKHKKYMREEF